MKKVYTMTFGCQQNEADTEKLTGIAGTRGFVPTASPEEADLIIINTCAIREHAELKALSKTGNLKKLKEDNPNLIIAMCGCMVQQEYRAADIKKRYPYVDIAFGTNLISSFGNILDEYAEKNKRLFRVEDYSINCGDLAEGCPIARDSSYSARVSIMYGCNNFCTYCIVPYVRGRERSREPEKILEEIRGLVKEGYKEITLLGQNVNSYGNDMDESVTFSKLLRDIDAIDGDFIIRFMTSHPKDASKELVDTIASSKKIAHQFHLPLQAGSDGILRAMNRRYTYEHFSELVRYMREKIPDITITSDIIVGFPGETEEDFLCTLRAINELEFDNIFSFIYSPRKGTKAYDLPGRLPADVLKDRMARLLAAQQKVCVKKNSLLVGHKIRVLCEGESKSNPEYFSGRTEGGKLVHFKRPENADSIIGKYIYIKIDKADAYMLHGSL